MKLENEKYTGSKNILNYLILNGIQNLAPAIETLINEAMKIERERALNATPYERSEDRKGYANGFKEREYASRLGLLKIQIPQVRGMSFYPK